MAGEQFDKSAKNHQRVSDVQDISTRQDAVAPRDVEPESATTSQPPPGTRPNNAGKVAAFIAAVAMVAGTTWLTIAIVAVRDQSFVQIDRVVESIDTSDGCRWRLEIALQNVSDDVLMVSRVQAVLNQGMHGARVEAAPPLDPEERSIYRVNFRLPPQAECLAVDEINHGNLIIQFANGASESVRF